MKMIIHAALGMFSVYLLFCFVTVTFDISQWDSIERRVCAVCMLGVAYIVALINNT